MAGLYRNAPMEPIVEEGQNVLLQSQNEYQLYKVYFIEPLPESSPLVVNLISGSTLAAGVATSSVSTQNQIDMPNGELGQFRFKMYDYAQVTLRQGQALGRNPTRFTEAVFTPHSQIDDPFAAGTEQFVWEQQRTYFVAQNIQQRTLNQIRIALYGYRYILEGINGVQGPTTGTVVNPFRIWRTLEEAMNDPGNFKFRVVPISGWGAN